jgi:hypothetical protein
VPDAAPRDILAAFYRFFVWPSAAGNDSRPSIWRNPFLLGIQGRANDDLSLAKKLIYANPILAQEVEVKAKAIERLDGRGVLKILPAQDVAGSHGKTYLFIGFDEIHGYRDWPQAHLKYRGFVDMSGGSSDDAVLAIGHEQDGLVIVDLVEHQGGGVPFDPPLAVVKFAGLLKECECFRVIGDRYAGETFRADFRRLRIGYEVSASTKSQLYEAMEPKVNAGEVELPDVPKLTEQLLTLVRRGARVDHQPGDHDDWANACAGCVDVLSSGMSRWCR